MYIGLRGSQLKWCQKRAPLPTQARHPWCLGTNDAEDIPS